MVFMNRKRGFEVAKGFENANINLPKRLTRNSAGYDIESAEDCTIPPFNLGQKPIFVKTGLKAYMQEDEVLILANRSSNPAKKGLVLANGIGVVDSDYYGNADNDGHIMFAFFNVQNEDIIIKKGERIGQAIFQKYLRADNDLSRRSKNRWFWFNKLVFWVRSLNPGLCKISPNFFDLI